MVNITYLDNATTLIDIVQGINNDTGQLFAILLLLSFALIIFIATKQFPTPSVLLFTSFMSGLVAYGLWIALLIPAWVLVIPISIATLTIIFIGVTAND